MQTIYGVDASCKIMLDKVPGFSYSEDGRDGKTLQVSTICCKPAAQLQTLRYGDAKALTSLACFSSLEEVRVGDNDTTLHLPGLASFELDALFSLDNNIQALGIDIFHSSGKQDCPFLLSKSFKKLTGVTTK